MELMGQGLVLMMAGMGIVYAFLYVLILVSDWSSRMVSRFESILPDDKPKKVVRSASRKSPAAGVVSPVSASSGESVTAPVPGTVLRLTASEGQSVAKGDEILVMDVMKMETPISAPCAGVVSIKVAVMDKVATGDTVAVIG
jgi:biotin carboxyl carrier protein